MNWKDDGQEIKDYAVKRNNGKHWSRYIQNLDCLYKEGITWSIVTASTFSMRFLPQGFICDNAGCAIFPSAKYSSYMLALFNTKYADRVLNILNPTINYQPGNIGSVPLIFSEEKAPDIDVMVNHNKELSKIDWDAFETSWDFKIHPLIQKLALIVDAFAIWESECQQRFDTLKANEEELNRIFIDIYGLQEELTPEVEDKDVTVRLADKERDIKSLISYLIGVVMGRYSLDVPGLAYAGGEWDASKYRTYQPDDDGIVPVYSQLGMEDGNLWCRHLPSEHGIHSGSAWQE